MSLTLTRAVCSDMWCVKHPGKTPKGSEDRKVKCFAWPKAQCDVYISAGDGDIWLRTSHNKKDLGCANFELREKFEWATPSSL